MYEIESYIRAGFDAYIGIQPLVGEFFCRFLYRFSIRLWIFLSCTFDIWKRNEGDSIKQPVMHISIMLVFWSLVSLVWNSAAHLFSVACFFTIHEHLSSDCIRKLRLSDWFLMFLNSLYSVLLSLICRPSARNSSLSKSNTLFFIRKTLLSFASCRRTAWTLARRTANENGLVI